MAGLYYNRIPKIKYAGVIVSLLLTAWFIVTFIYFPIAEEYKTGHAIFYPLTGVVFTTATVLLSQLKVDGLNWLKLLGKLSYGIYLFHMPIYLIFGHLSFVYTLAISIVLSYFVYTYFEVYFRRISKNYKI
jgi:peptidoglycan/LPS O-acetylase OafA/YrhL